MSHLFEWINSPALHQLEQAEWRLPIFTTYSITLITLHNKTRPVAEDFDDELELSQSRWYRTLQTYERRRDVSLLIVRRSKSHQFQLYG